MEVLNNFIVVIISPYIHISNHHTVHVKLTQLYVNYIKTGDVLLKVLLLGCCLLAAGSIPNGKQYP